MFSRESLVLAAESRTLSGPQDELLSIATDADDAACLIASVIGERARGRILYCLMDGRGRTSTELAVVAGVMPSTASLHLKRLKSLQLVKVRAEGKHRYYSLNGTDVASALEGLSVLAGAPERFAPNVPHRLRAARVCYDHIAGNLGVSLLNRFNALKWLSGTEGCGGAYDVTAEGMRAFERIGINMEETRRLRRRFAFACLDWSERRPHLAGALGTALLGVALKRKWLTQDLDSRALSVTQTGRHEMIARFGLEDVSSKTLGLADVRTLGVTSGSF
jgi:DNA-binding transcriptional ArsR family regulator